MSDKTADRDLDVQLRVRDALEWCPEVAVAGIGVSVVDGAVTLSGEVPTYAEAVAATEVALRVRGVRTLVDDLTVAAKDASWPVSEAEIAHEVDHALRSTTIVPETVKAAVRKHHVTLTGEVDWEYERAAARQAIQYLRGVHSISNAITLKPRPAAPDTGERVAAALARDAGIDPANVHVVVDGTRVTLTGTVGSWADRRRAGSAAWSSPHVTDVDNRILVDA
ncbi:MAG TPA: BON domain-containing protein [Microbacterium sp.]|uniref:BON domain-containing protein n=1 Tax=Microbacterium sp. TaxID=51671 RepID=UPI002B45ABFE|nr:BON domain-containing protein [Microbacterium sp.]HKT56522.1 BON domain-containing protein [Microbacterium sp.]